MLDDDDGVAQVAQFLERSDEPLVVALVETDAGFVEDVEHIDQLRAYLRGQSDALALTSRERRRRAVQCEIVKPHLEHESQARLYLLDNLGGYLLLVAVHVAGSLVEPIAQLGDVHARQLGDVLVPYLVRERLAVEPHAVTFGTLGSGQELVGPLLPAGAVVVLHHVAQILDDAVELYEIVGRGVYEVFADAHVAQRTVHNLAHRLLRNGVDRRFQRTVVLVEDALYLPENHLVLVFP